MSELSRIGADWVVEQISSLTEEVYHVTPSSYNEDNRYLPESVTSIPGYLRYQVNPFMQEIVDCFDIDSPVREVTLKKGVQITYTTALESGLLYFMGHIKTLPVMYMTADKELAAARVENNIIPMLTQSGMAHIIRSSDEGNSRKTGKTKDHLQWEGGGYLVPFGARNADKMRSYSIAVLLKDEIDAWPDTVGKDGDPDALSDDRCSAYWERRKIFRGSTPLIKGRSKVERQYRRGDQRKYHVLCRACGFPQVLRWEHVDKETGVIGGFMWDLDTDGTLALDSVRYCCQSCGAPHYEHDKERLFSPDHGAHWAPTAKPVEPGVRSYHLPAMYSPIGMQPWYKCVSMYLRGFDPEARKVTDIKQYQVFYNNILAEPFEIMGTKVRFVSVSAHRRPVYRLGQIPNEYAEKWSGSKILFLTCQVDVHKRDLAVAIMGWTEDARCYLIDYDRYEITAEEDQKQIFCEDASCSVWQRLREVVEEKQYTTPDGKKYRIVITLVDSGYSNATVVGFCAEYQSGVYPIVGRDRPGKTQRIREFSEFKTQQGTTGYTITVDHYKDRMAPVLRREWSEQAGTQKPYHFNAPVDITDAQLKELTVETRRERIDEKGSVTYVWHRPGNARNELWDLLGYGSAAVEIIAWSLCVKVFELDTIDWGAFWEYAKGSDNDAFFGRS